MSRTNIYSRPNPDDYDPDAPRLLGWFDPDTAVEQIPEDTRWDGNNHRGVMSGLQCGYEELYRTKGGRWVRHYNARNEYNGPEYYEFFDDEQAQGWLLENGSDAVVAKYFGPVEPERGPGRPEVGPAFSLRFPRELLARLDQVAATEGASRAAKIRQLVEAGI